MNVLLTPESLEGILSRYGIRVRIEGEWVVLFRWPFRFRTKPILFDGCSVKFRVKGNIPFALVCIFMRIRGMGFRCGWNHLWIDLCHLLRLQAGFAKIEEVKVVERGLFIRLGFPGGRELGF